MLDSGDWHYVSPAIERVLGWTVEEWQAHPAPWATSVHPDDMAAAVEQEERAVESGSLISEYRMRHKDGHEVWIRDEAVLLEEDGEPQWHGILTDFTEQRMLEERLHQSQKIEAVGQLAGGIAHDFNNLLVAINGYGELALARAGDDAELRHALEQIAFASAKARDLTQRLLSFSRKEARISGTVDLNEVVASAHPMLRRLIGADVELVTLPAEQTCFVSVDPTELDQAVLNLAVNARDAMPAGGRLTISTGAATRADSSYAFLRVADTGSGIEPELVPRLFEPFFTTKEAGVGTGLGLAMVRDFVGRCGGMIEVETGPAEGTAFTLLLPAVSAPAVLPAPAPSTETASVRSDTILLIEDDDSVREIAGRDAHPGRLHGDRGALWLGGARPRRRASRDRPRPQRRGHAGPLRPRGRPTPAGGRVRRSSRSSCPATRRSRKARSAAQSSSASLSPARSSLPQSAGRSTQRSSLSQHPGLTRWRRRSTLPSRAE